MNSIGDRLKIVRGSESRESFASKFGTHRNTLARWESGAGLPDFVFLQKIGEELELSSDWLLFGFGPMKRSESNTKLQSHEATLPPPEHPPTQDDEKLILLTEENRQLRTSEQELRKECRLLLEENRLVREENRQLREENKQLWQENKELSVNLARLETARNTATTETEHRNIA